MSATVVPLSRAITATCPACEAPAEWQVGPKLRACSKCLAFVLSHFYETEWDGFLPATVSPLRTPGGAA